MRPVLFTIGGYDIPAFWTTALLGFVLAFFAIRAEVRRRKLGDALAFDMVLYAYIGGWIGARLFLIPTAWEIFTTDPVGFLLSGSGWVWYGGIIGGAIGMWALARRTKISFLTLADICSPALALGLAMGRVGCQLSGDGDYGVPTNLPWGMSYPNGVVPTTERVHPAPIYEMLACLGIFAFLWKKRHANPPAGWLFGWYLIFSGLTRLLIEVIRRNPHWIFGLTTAQAISLGMMLLGGWLLYKRMPSGPAGVMDSLKPG